MTAARKHVRKRHVFHLPAVGDCGPGADHATGVSRRRGFFMETFQASAFRAAGIATDFAQDNHSLSTAGVVRGLHYQAAPHAQGKTGARRARTHLGRRRGPAPRFRPVMAGMRVELPTKITPCSGCRRGSRTASPRSARPPICFTNAPREYNPASERGVRWNDPALGLIWPVTAPLVSPRDAALPLLKNIGAPPT